MLSLVAGGEGLGSASTEVPSFVDSPWEALNILRSRMTEMDRRKLEEGERGTVIDMQNE